MFLTEVKYLSFCLLLIVHPAEWHLWLHLLPVIASSTSLVACKCSFCFMEVVPLYFTHVYDLALTYYFSSVLMFTFQTDFQLLCW